MNYKKRILIVILILLLGGAVISFYLLTKFKEELATRRAAGEKQDTSETEARIQSSALMANTTWRSDDDSELVFTEDIIDWYQFPTDHDDNYYSGKYQFYIGTDAARYVSEKLPEYGITAEEAESMVQQGEKSGEGRFVVFDIRYDKYLLGGEEQQIDRPLVPWYGFLAEENEKTFLFVVNMNTGTMYPFEKQAE